MFAPFAACAYTHHRSERTKPVGQSYRVGAALGGGSNSLNKELFMFPYW